MASVSKRLATDETLMLLVDAVNNTETVKQAKAEIQAEGTAQVNNVKSTAEEMVKDINQVPKNTSDIAELNSNLDTLEFGEIAGGKNYWSLGNTTATSTNYAWENKPLNLPSGTYTFSAYSDMAYELQLFDGSGNKLLSIANTEMNKRWNKTFTISSNIVSASLYVHAGTVKDIQIEEGITATDYEPYIPSVKILAEEVADINDSLSVIGKCKNLLNPTLQNTTSSGVTCTNNGDGTYTLNGTATYNSGFIIQDIIYKARVTYKLVGCPIGGSDSTYRLSSDWGSGLEYGSGKIINYSTDKTTKIGIYFSKGMTFNNLVFKPMLTTNLNATYDDFVPYTGEGETLTADVAELKNDLNNTTMCSYTGNGATVSTTDWEYHGTNITIPKGYYALVVAERKWSSGKPSGVAISLSDTENTEHSMCTQTEGVQSVFSTSFIVTANDNPVNVYLWSKGAVGKSGEVMFATLHKIA